MMKRTSRTSKGSRSPREDVKLPSLKKYSVDGLDGDFSKLSHMIEKKSDSHFKEDSPHEHTAYRGSRIRRNMVCEYIKEVREDLLTFD